MAEDRRVERVSSSLLVLLPIFNDEVDQSKQMQSRARIFAEEVGEHSKITGVE